MTVDPAVSIVSGMSIINQRRHVGLPRHQLPEHMWMPGPRLWIGATRWIPSGVTLRETDLRREIDEYMHVGDVAGMVVAEADMGRFLRVYAEGDPHAPMDPKLHPEFDDVDQCH